MVEEVQTKQCPRCGEVKPLTRFHARKDSADGANSQCKTCVSAYGKVYRQVKKDSLPPAIVLEQKGAAQEKQCPRCKEIKPLMAGFGVNKGKAGGFSSHCRTCRSKAGKKYYQGNRERIDAQHKAYAVRNVVKVKAWKREWAKTPRIQVLNMLNQARHRAKRKGLPFNITLGDIRLPVFCPVLGITLDYGHKGGHLLPSSPSLDRRIPELGYVRGNVEVISMKANSIKGYATPEEIARVALYFGMMA